MDKLSPEIMDMILGHLQSHHNRTIKIPRERRERQLGIRDPFVALYAPLAIISRPWQYVVERRSFREVDVQGTPEGITIFSTAFSRPWRQVALQELNLSIPYLCSCEIRAVDPACRHKRDAYVGAMTALYRSMEAWETARAGFGRIQPRIRIEIDMPRKTRRDRTLFAEKNMALWKGSEAAKWISQLFCYETLDFVAACQLPALLSNLETLNLQLPSYQGKGGMPIYGEQHLAYLYKTLTSALIDACTSLPQLHTLSIDMGLEEDEGPPSPGFDMRNEDGVDELCEAIRLLSQGMALRKLKLIGIPLSLDLFQNSRLLPGDYDTTTWPLLEELEVTFPGVATSGEWYLKDDPELPQRLDNVRESLPFIDDFGWWQAAIEPATFNTLQEAFARALLRMPALRHASLTVQCITGDWLYVGAVDRPRGGYGKMNFLSSKYWKRELQEDAEMTEEAGEGTAENDMWLARTAAKIEKTMAREKDRKAEEALMMTDRAIEIEAHFVDGLLRLEEEISRRRPWDSEMFGKDAIWQPTPEIAHLWKRWVTWEGRGTWS